jgi:hypothetical protein
MPGWDLAASVYATDVQLDYDAGWYDEEKATVSARGRALAFEHDATRPSGPIATLPAEQLPGSPAYASETLPPSVGAPTVRPALWTPADASPPSSVPDAVIPWRKICVFLVLCAHAVGGYKAYPSAHAWYIARGVPAALRGYVGGKGVRYAPPRQGYAVRLPKAPTHGDAALGVLDSPWHAIHRSVATGAGYQIAVRVGELAPGATLPFGVGGALADPRLAGHALTGVELQLILFEDEAAYDFRIEGKRPLRGRVFQHEARVYVVTVQAARVDRVFDTMMRSFTFDDA